jgi:hypothetical protein
MACTILSGLQPSCHRHVHRVTHWRAKQAQLEMTGAVAGGCQLIHKGLVVMLTGSIGGPAWM